MLQRKLFLNFFIEFINIVLFLKRLLKFSIPFLVLGFFVGLNFQDSSAYEVTYELQDKRILSMPLVCVIEPEKNDYLSEKFIDLLMKETKVAVAEWEVRLKQAEQKNYRHLWEINYTKVPVSEQGTFLYDQCHVFITFEDKPQDENEWYKKIGRTQYEVRTTGRSNIIIYYAGIDFCKTEDEKFYYFDPCYSESPRTITQLATIVRHEFGHALGLGHYVADDLQVNVVWARGVVPSPSIMAKYSHQNAVENRIKTIDVAKVRELYGNSGFLGLESLEEKSYITSLEVSQLQYVIPKSGFEVVTIWGFLNETYFSKGVPVTIHITKPDGTIEQRTSRATEDQFQVQFVIDKTMQQGTYLVSATYRDSESQVVVFDVVSAENAVVFNQTSSDIPPWIKNDAKKWVKGEISDTDFLLGVQQLIRIGEIIPPAPEYDIEGADPIKVPKWVKTITTWWAEDKVSDVDFKNAMKYLVKKGIMII